jgi:sugar porter (SP) family MFS transporter
MYIAEISPSNWRGRFVAFFQFNIVLGIVLAYLSNYCISGIQHDWQWMLGVCAVPALVFLLLLYTVPESPRWLVHHTREEEACAVLVKTGEPQVEREITEIRQSLVSTGSGGGRLFQKQYRKPVMIAFLIATFNQLAGINAILYYAPRIFELSGVFRDGALIQSIIIGLTNLTFTMLGMAIIDKVGRKKLIYVGSIGMFIALSLVSYGFYAEKFTGYYMLVCLMGFIAFFAISLGATIWVVISEVFPNSVRYKGQVLGSMTHWVWAALLTWFFPMFLNIGGTYIFGFFAVAVLCSFFFALWMPETQNKSLEQIQKELTSK